jgi:hypothetical protein
MAASMKAVEKIKDIRVIDFGQGISGGGGLMPNIAGANGDGGRPGNGTGGGSLPDNIVQSLLNYRMQAPLVDELLTDLGFNPKENPNTMLHRLSQSIASDLQSGDAAGGKTAAKRGRVTASAVPPGGSDDSGESGDGDSA